MPEVKRVRFKQIFAAVQWVPDMNLPTKGIIFSKMLRDLDCMYVEITEEGCRIYVVSPGDWMIFSNEAKCGKFIVKKAFFEEHYEILN